jgi:tetratricopeptide (TPR) repeat protein
VPQIGEKSAAGPVPEPPVAQTQGAQSAHAGSDLTPPDSIVDTKAKIEALMQESLAIASRLHDDFPGNPDALGLMGNVQYYYGNTERAAECWQQCLRRDPSRSGLYDALAKLALRKAEYEKAAEWCRRGLAQNPDAPYLHARLGEALTGLGKLDEAVPELDRETRLSPSYAEGYFLLGQAYSLRHEYQKAKTCHETAVKLDAKQSKYQVRYYRALANACTKLGLDEESRQLNESIKLISDKAPSYDDLLDAHHAAAQTCGDAAAVYRSQQKVSMAEELLTRAAALDSKNTSYRLSLIAILQEAGRDSKAAEVCKELIVLEPNNAVHHVELGFFYARMKQFDAARKAAQRALELAPDNPLCKQFYEQMQRTPR